MTDMATPEAERDARRAAIVAFLQRWDEVRPAIDGAFIVAQIHGPRYTGPTLEEELRMLRELVGIPSPPSDH